MNVSLHSIEFEAGEKRDIADLFSSDSADMLDSVTRSNGPLNYRKAKSDSFTLARTSVKKTLDSSGINPNDIDAIIYASNSMENYYEGGHANNISKICEDLSLDKATIHGVAYNDCANLVSALMLAVGLISAARARHIIVVTVDLCTEEKKRFFFRGAPLCIYSDAAASCIISRDYKRDFELLCVNSRCDHSLPVLMSTDSLAYSNKLRSVLKSLGDDVVSKGLPLDKAQFITINTLAKSGDALSIAFKIPSQNIMRGVMPEFAHTYGADVLIGCWHYIKNTPEQLNPDNEFILMLLGTRQTWGIIALRRTFQSE